MLACCPQDECTSNSLLCTNSDGRACGDGRAGGAPTIVAAECGAVACGVVRRVTLYAHEFTAAHVCIANAQQQASQCRCTVWRDRAPALPRACEDGVHERLERMTRRHGVHGVQCVRVAHPRPCSAAGPAPKLTTCCPHARCGDAQAAESTKHSLQYKGPAAHRRPRSAAHDVHVHDS